MLLPEKSQYEHLYFTRKHLRIFADSFEGFLHALKQVETEILLAIIVVLRGRYKLELGFSQDPEPHEGFLS